MNINIYIIELKYDSIFYPIIKIIKIRIYIDIQKKKN